MVPVVIIPVLNRYDLLERCIDSLDYPIEKLIIIDNGGKIAQDCL
ncbi:MAG: glycosyltransferase family 2 protein, partial [Betaproteobacteria bacterium]|nr:glycosyltransferase family 2 protein [Betaproteobacteria bacterium]